MPVGAVERDIDELERVAEVALPLNLSDDEEGRGKGETLIGGNMVLKTLEDGGVVTLRVVKPSEGVVEVKPDIELPGNKDEADVNVFDPVTAVEMPMIAELVAELSKPREGLDRDTVKPPVSVNPILPGCVGGIAGSSAVDGKLMAVEVLPLNGMLVESPGSKIPLVVLLEIGSPTETEMPTDNHGFFDLVIELEELSPTGVIGVCIDFELGNKGHEVLKVTLDMPGSTATLLVEATKEGQGRKG